MTVVVTGAAQGLGFGACDRLARLGADLILLDINASALALAQQRLSVEFPSQRITSVTADLSAPESVRAAAKQISNITPTVDVLVNNAGIYPPAQRRLNSEGQEITFAIAHLGHFRLTHLLLPVMSSSARIVGISSMVQRGATIRLDDLNFSRGGYKPILAYQQAKLSCLLFSLELQRRLDRAGSGIKSIAVHPGVCRTDLGRNRPRAATDSFLQKVASEFLAWGLSHFGQTPEHGAESIVMAIADPSVPGGVFLGPRGVMQAFGSPLPQKPGKAGSSPELAAALWQRSEAITGTSWPLYQSRISTTPLPESP